MASAPVPSLPPRRRSLAGAVVLILLGVIFLLGNMHVITWPALSVWFAHYWPLLLILWGVIKVIEHMLATRQGYRSSGIGAGGVFLVILIVICGLVATGLAGMDWPRIRNRLADIGITVPEVFGKDFEYTSQIDQPVASHGSFRLALQRGSITVLPSNDEKVHMSVKKTVKAFSQEEADRINEATQPQIKTDEIPMPPMPPVPDLSNVPGLPSSEREKIKSQIKSELESAKSEIRAEINQARAEAARGRAEADRARAEAERAREQIIHVNIDHPTDSYADMDIEVQVPPTLPLELSTAHGNLEIRSRQADVKLTSSHGDITVQDLTGNANITMHGGDLSAHNIKGNVTVDGRAGDTDISDVNGLVVLTGDYMGETTARNLSEGFHFNSSRTSLETGKLVGELHMDSGDLRASNVNGNFKVTTRSKDIHLEDITGDVEVNNRNSDVELRTSKPPAGSITINNKDGGIEIALPSHSAFQVEATTRDGQIRSDFEQVKIQNPSEDHSQGSATAMGAVGAGGKKIQLTTEHSDIEIHKSDEKTSENKDHQSGKSDK